MRTFRITNGFDEISDAYLLVRANYIKASMTNNDYFANPQPSLSELNSIIGSFAAALDVAEGGDRQQIAVKNSLRSNLIDKLHLLGNYVLFTAASNAVVATSSGFRISQAAQPKPPLTVPEGVLLKAGLNQGELELSCKRVKGAISYLYEIKPLPLTEGSEWKTTAGSAAKNTFAGLESGKEYACRIAAIGPRQQTVYSGVVTRIAV